MSVPNWYELILLALAAYRVFRLIAEDDILEVPRRRVLRLARDWEEGQSLPAEYRGKIALFIRCPACLGFWLALAWWGAFQLWEFGTLVVAVPWTLSAVIIFLRRNLDPPDE